METSLAKSLGRNVRKARRDLGLTQAYLAERLDLEEATVRAIEADPRGVSVETLLKLAAELRTRVGVRLGEEKESRSALHAEAAKLLDDLDRTSRHSALNILREVHDQFAGRSGRRRLAR